jgi:cation diffusion facilitator family transporter
LENQKKRLRIITAVLIFGVLITIIKFIAYFITHSNAIYTDALENIINVVAGGFAFYSIYLAAQPKDSNHPYGHGKVEFFAVGFEGALIVFAAINIIYKSIDAFIHPQEIHQLDKGIFLSVLAGLLNFIIGVYLVRQAKRLNSITLEADGKHLKTDAYTSAGLVLGLVLIKITQLNFLDSIISLILGFFILYNGYHLIRKSISGLMDEVDTNLVNEIVSILQKERKPEWIDVHNLRAQKYGHDLHIDCHITIPYYFDLVKVHNEVEAIERLIENNVENNVELFIHADPCLPDCCNYCGLNCAVRSHPQERTIVWNTNLVMNNAKHFKEHV